MDANANANTDADKVDEVRFNIPECGPNSDTQNVCQINLLSTTLPIINGPLDIDGSMPESRTNLPGNPTKRPGIAIDGTSAGFGGGLVFHGGPNKVTSGSSVRGMILTNFRINPSLSANLFRANLVNGHGSAIFAIDTNDFKVMGNYIGTNSDGTSIVNTRQSGTMYNFISIFDGCDRAQVGSVDPNDRNVLLVQRGTGIGQNGILFYLSGNGNSHTINDGKAVGNYLGVNAAGIPSNVPVTFLDGIEPGIQNNTGFSIPSPCAIRCELNNMEISHNVIYKADDGIFPFLDGALTIDDLKNLSADKLLVAHNEIRNSNFRGIRMRGRWTHPELSYNAITSSAFRGIDIDAFTPLPVPAENGIIKGNYFDLNGWNGIRFAGGHNFLVTDNVITNSGRHGVLLADNRGARPLGSPFDTGLSGVSLLSNSIYNNGLLGIDLLFSSNAVTMI